MKEQMEEGGKDSQDIFENGVSRNQVATKSPKFRGFKHVSKMLATVSQTGLSGSTPFSRDLEKYRADSERIRFDGGVKSGEETSPATRGSEVEDDPPLVEDIVIDEIVEEVLMAEEIVVEEVEIAMDDPLDYWVEHEARFETILPLVAEDILAIPATSTPSERLFSVSGILSGGRMSSISPKVWCNIF